MKIISRGCDQCAREKRVPISAHPVCLIMTLGEGDGARTYEGEVDVCNEHLRPVNALAGLLEYVRLAVPKPVETAALPVTPEQVSIPSPPVVDPIPAFVEVPPEREPEPPSAKAPADPVLTELPRGYVRCLDCTPPRVVPRSGRHDHAKKAHRADVYSIQWQFPRGGPVCSRCGFTALSMQGLNKHLPACSKVR